MKYLLLLLVLGLVLWKLLGRARGSGAAEGRQAPTRRAGPAAPEAMVACAHCGLHLPAADAVLDGSHIYCSPAHRALGPRAPHA